MKIKKYLINDSYYWRFINFNFNVKQKRALIKSFFKGHHIIIKHDFIFNPNFILQDDQRPRIVKPKLQLNYSLINFYFSFFKPWSKPFYKDHKIIINKPRRTSTFKFKKQFKLNHYNKSLDWLLFWNGFADSIIQARKLIKGNFVFVDNQPINNFKVKIRTGSIIKCKSPLTFFYFLRARLFYFYPVKRNRKLRDKNNLLVPKVVNKRKRWKTKTVNFKQFQFTKNTSLKFKWNQFIYF